MALSSRKPWLFVDKNGLIITAKERLAQLAGAGFQYEACAAQAAVLEALLIFAIQIKATVERRSETEEILKCLDDLTLGGLVRRAKDIGLFEEDLLVELTSLKGDRNHLIHQHLTSAEPFDYRGFIARSEGVIEALWEEVRRHFRTWARETGRSEDEAFQ